MARPIDVESPLGQGSAVLPAWVYNRAAREAELHLQITIDRVDPPAHSPGQAQVVGRIVRVFRGDASLIDTTITLEVACLTEGDQPPPGGVLWRRTEALLRAHVLEAYVNTDADRYAIAHWLCTFLEAPTDDPQMVGDPYPGAGKTKEQLIHVLDLIKTSFAVLIAVAFVGAGIAGLAYAIWVLAK